MNKRANAGEPQAPEPVAEEPQEATPRREGFPVVGIGASAGGLAAFEALFSAMPTDGNPGMAFVLIQHLSPGHSSLLTELVQRYTAMPVHQAADGMVVQPDSVYIIPPNYDMAFADGVLQLLKPVEARGRRMPIDFFFRSLAQDQHERAICIVLSGTGSDGTLGLRAVKGEGGMAMAQDPDTAEYAGMPRSAIATGLVDYVLPPADMPAQIISYVTHAFGRADGPVPPPAPKGKEPMGQVLGLLYTRTGHDFSLYKSSTIARRVQRRLAVHQIDRLEDYARFLQHNPAEIEALFRDLLIGVTSFFRDPEAFAALERQALPPLFAEKQAGTPLRVWVPACSTGEEAYSIAILLQERQETLKRSLKLQVFATDVDPYAVEQARAGVYPASIAADVSAERLERFFTREPDSDTYRIVKAVRDMVVFSEQDIVRDPPFSRLDLISCRNLMIYMGEELQRRLIPLFHYALNSGGFLFLGTSESVGGFNDLFHAVDRKWKLYQRRGEGRPLPQPFAVPLAGQETHALRSIAAATGRQPGRAPLRELTERALLQHYGAVGALVTERGDIVYLHGRTGLYLGPPAGDFTANLLPMAREGLRYDLAIALHQAVAHRTPVHRPGLRVKTNGESTTTDLTVLPVPPDVGHSASSLYLVILEHKPTADEDAAAAAEGATDAAALSSSVLALRRELRAKEEYLQATNEELQTANEELKSANEELQSMNEELQLTNEELETAKEELQSMNEELNTVNVELEQRVAELSRLNSDMNNLFAGSGIGTVFVDHDLRILRYTPTVSQVINLIPSDVGRPVSQIVTNLKGYTLLAADVRTVLDTLEPVEAEVQTEAGKWFLLHIRPYRTLDNIIEGAVVTFVDITEMQRVRQDLQEREAKWRLLIETVPQGVVFVDREGRITDANPAAERFLGLTTGRVWVGDGADSRWRAVRQDGSDFPPEEYPPAVALRSGREVRDVVMGVKRGGEDGVTWVRVSAVPQFLPGEDTPYQVYATIDSVSGKLATEDGQE